MERRPSRKETHTGLVVGVNILAQLIALSIGVWGMPPCGVPQGSIAHLEEGIAGVAHPESCSFEIDARFARRTIDELGNFCDTVLHEVGHLALGPIFAAENPADPWHSLTGVMSKFGSDSVVCRRYVRKVEQDRRARAKRIA